MSCRKQTPPHLQRQLLTVARQGSNALCADCGCKDPTWASINLGVFICMNCAGIHRSVGVHITQVRSLTLDQWDKRTIEYMARMGNDVVNNLYHARLTDQYRIAPNCGSKQREEFIRMKYVSKGFFSSKGGGVNSTASEPSTTTDDSQDMSRFLTMTADQLREALRGLSREKRRDIRAYIKKNPKPAPSATNGAGGSGGVSNDVFSKARASGFSNLSLTSQPTNTTTTTPSFLGGASTTRPRKPSREDLARGLFSGMGVVPQPQQPSRETSDCKQNPSSTASVTAGFDSGVAAQSKPATTRPTRRVTGSPWVSATDLQRVAATQATSTTTSTTTTTTTTTSRHTSHNSREVEDLFGRSNSAQSSDLFGGLTTKTGASLGGNSDNGGMLGGSVESSIFAQLQVKQKSTPKPAPADDFDIFSAVSSAAQPAQSKSNAPPDGELAFLKSMTSGAASSRGGGAEDGVFGAMLSGNSGSSGGSGGGQSMFDGLGAGNDSTGSQGSLLSALTQSQPQTHPSTTTLPSADGAGVGSSGLLSTLGTLSTASSGSLLASLGQPQQQTASPAPSQDTSGPQTGLGAGLGAGAGTGQNDPFAHLEESSESAPAPAPAHTNGVVFSSQQFGSGGSGGGGGNVVGGGGSAVGNDPFSGLSHGSSNSTIGSNNNVGTSNLMGGMQLGMPQNNNVGLQLGLGGTGSTFQSSNTTTLPSSNNSSSGANVSVHQKIQALERMLKMQESLASQQYQQQLLLIDQQSKSGMFSSDQVTAQRQLAENGFNNALLQMKRLHLKQVEALYNQPFTPATTGSNVSSLLTSSSTTANTLSSLSSALSGTRSRSSSRAGRARASSRGHAGVGMGAGSVIIGRGRSRSRSNSQQQQQQQPQQPEQTCAYLNCERPRTVRAYCIDHSKSLTTPAPSATVSQDIASNGTFESGGAVATTNVSDVGNGDQAGIDAGGSGGEGVNSLLSALSSGSELPSFAFASDAVGSANPTQHAVEEPVAPVGVGDESVPQQEDSFNAVGAVIEDADDSSDYSDF